MNNLLADVPNTLALFSGEMPIAGRLTFAAVFVFVIVVIVLIPHKRIYPDQPRIPIWKHAKTWAIVLATLQCLIYLLW